jgi:hypothetical protein
VQPKKQTKKSRPTLTTKGRVARCFAPASDHKWVLCCISMMIFFSLPNNSNGQNGQLLGLF